MAKLSPERRRQATIAEERRRHKQRGIDQFQKSNLSSKETGRCPMCLEAPVHKGVTCGDAVCMDLWLLRYIRAENMPAARRKSKAFQKRWSETLNSSEKKLRVQADIGRESVIGDHGSDG